MNATNFIAILFFSQIAISNCFAAAKGLDSNRIEILRNFGKCLQGWSFSGYVQYQKENEFHDPKICGAMLNVDAKEFDLIKGALNRNLLETRFWMHSSDVVVTKYKGTIVAFHFENNRVEHAAVVVKD